MRQKIIVAAHFSEAIKIKEDFERKKDPLYLVCERAFGRNIQGRIVDMWITIVDNLN